jgi:hypothetical protein
LLLEDWGLVLVVGALDVSVAILGGRGEKAEIPDLLDDDLLSLILLGVGVGQAFFYEKWPQNNPLLFCDGWRINAEWTVERFNLWVGEASNCPYRDSKL